MSGADVMDPRWGWSTVIRSFSGVEDSSGFLCFPALGLDFLLKRLDKEGIAKAQGMIERTIEAEDIGREQTSCLFARSESNDRRTLKMIDCPIRP